MQKLTRHIFAQKLTEYHLKLIIGINIFLPIGSVCLINPVIEFQTEHYLLDNVSEFYIRKLLVLILLLDAVILGIIDYLNIMLPFHRLYHIAEEYETVTGMKTNEGHGTSPVKFGLEKRFLATLEAQKEINVQTIKQESERQTTELYALQSQINPHFLYNTLDCIRGYAILHHVNEIADMTEALSQLFRSMIAKEGKLLLLKEEFESVRNYMAIQDFRFQHKFVYECKVGKELMEGYLIPNMSLQPLVENAVTHGLEQKMGTGTVRITGYVTEKRLVLNVWDDGIGISEKRLRYLNERMMCDKETVTEKSTDFQMGIALININKRIKLRFGEKFGIYIMSTPGISTVTELTLPAIKADVQREEFYG